MRDADELHAHIAELEARIDAMSKRQAATRGEFTRALAPIEANLRIAANALTRALHDYNEAAKLCEPPSR